MYIVMHCGGMSFNGDTIKTESLGGSESAAYYMAKELVSKGHHVRLFTSSKEDGKFDGVQYNYTGEASEQYPLGELFHHYAENVPSDVVIIQRHPQAFLRKYNSKINLWWVHDLALYRSKESVSAQFMNIDGVLTVSEYHKEQVCEVYGINPDIVYPITNGIDLSLFEGDMSLKDSKIHDAAIERGIKSHLGDEVKLLYSSRPERGLENLVKEDGIMERLLHIDTKYHLYVCMYANFPQHMEAYYNYLFSRIEMLPNCTALGSLTKQELADVMRQCDAMVYPTNFEEVSCITAMECMAAGLPFISSNHAALPETCEGSGSILIPLLEDGEPDLDNFVSNILNRFSFSRTDYDENGWYGDLEYKQLASAKKYSWSISCDGLLNHVRSIFNKCQTNKGSIAEHFMAHSDLYALNHYFDNYITEEDIKGSTILQAKLNEIKTCYSFMAEASWDKHYQDYYDYEKSKGVQYGYNGHDKENGREDVSGNPRFESVSNFVSTLDDNATVLDYGCAHGHYTINLAKRFPNLNFIGIDIAASNVETAKIWASEEGLANVNFYNARVNPKTEYIEEEGTGTAIKLNTLNRVDLIIAAEVIEHLEDYTGTVDSLCTYLKDSGKFVATTPYGTWEASGYKKEWPWRAHVHHFERQDLAEAFGHHPSYNVKVAPCGNDLGSYIWSFDKPINDSRNINYDRKIIETKPARQTVSLCMIVHDAENTIRKCLEKALPNVDEVIIGYDKTSNEDTRKAINGYINKYWPEKPLTIFYIDSPLKTGFSEARNIVIEKASCDWVMWLDSDEEITVKQNFKLNLRNNQFNGYAIPQHHFAVEPLGVMRTDYPCKMFRSSIGIEFNGFVHEHPESEINKGIEYTAVIGSAEVIHPAYENEEVRMQRFNRNINLLVKDREENPNRILGRYLWIRDLAQMNQQQYLSNGNQISNDMLIRCNEGIQEFVNMLDDKDTPLRLLVDTIPFYSTLVELTGNGFQFYVKTDSSKMNGGVHPEHAADIVGHFLNKAHVEKLMKLIVDERTKNYESRYF